MWKQKVIELTKNFKHPAWGFAHFTRVYELSLELAKGNGIEIDEDAIFAASYLHDIGAFEPYRIKGKDHSDVAIDNCDEILSPIGFPLDKVPLVKDVIKSHMFYVSPSEHSESIIFHDADTLDFMGVVGIIRILSIVGKEDWTPDLNSAIKLIQKFSKELPQCLKTREAKRIGVNRKNEMDQFLKNLEYETNNLRNI